MARPKGHDERLAYRVSLDEGVDRSDDAGLVAAVVVRVGAGRLEVGRRDGVVHREPVF